MRAPYARWIPWLLASLWSLWPIGSHAAGLLLRRNTPMPAAPIRQLLADRRGEQILTYAEDGSIEIWDAPSGVPVRAVRFPADAGTAQAVALSSDGRLLAAALRSAQAEERGDQVYLTQVRKGRIIRRIVGDLPEIVRLSLSPDGTRLAVGLRRGGLYVYDAATGKQLAQDPDYEGPCSDLDFAADGRLVAASGEGALRLYDASLQLLRKVSVSSGIYSVRFSSDAKKLAVGYQGAQRVEVYSGQDLSLLYRPSTEGGDQGDLRLVAWSSGDSVLYGAGTWRGGRVIRRWSASGQGSFQDLRAAAQPLTGLVALPQDALAFAAEGPAWGILDANGRQTQLHCRDVAAFQPGTKAGSLSLDRTGSRVWFALNSSGADQSPTGAVFSVVGHTLLANPTADPRISTSQTAPIPIALPQGTVAARLSEDGRLVVAALGDGTLRWYTAAGGREVLALLLQWDCKRWIAWTPSGYYDASAGGDDLLGWQVDRGSERLADTFPLGRFRDRLYRPDVIARVLFVQDESQAVAMANAESGREREELPINRLLPPVVTVLRPLDGALFRSSTLDIQVAVRSPSGEPVTQVRALIQGRLAQSRDVRALVLVKRPTEELDPDATLYSLPLVLPQEDCTVAILAETALSRSEPSLLRLRWGGARAAATGDSQLPNLYVLAVGTSRYRQPALRLGYPAKDAQDLAAALKEQEGKLYRRTELRVLVDEGATRGNILDGLLWLRQKTTRRDVAILFLAGHGINDPGDGKYYYLPYDADLSAAADTMVDAGQLQRFLSTIHGKALLFIDTCHAGNVWAAQRGPSGLDVNRVVDELASIESGVVVYAASTGGQVSQESTLWRNGAFTKAVVEGLRGRADYSRTGRVTVSSLDHYISNRVRELTREEQTPATAKPSTVPDFLIARVPPPLPLYKRPVFWALLGTTAVVATLAGVGLGLALQPRPPTSDGGAYTLTFPGVN